MFYFTLLYDFRELQVLNIDTSIRLKKSIDTRYDIGFKISIFLGRYFGIDIVSKKYRQH